jgi:hypothetical protein
MQTCPHAGIHRVGQFDWCPTSTQGMANAKSNRHVRIFHYPTVSTCFAVPGIGPDESYPSINPRPLLVVADLLQIEFVRPNCLGHRLHFNRRAQRIASILLCWLPQIRNIGPPNKALRFARERGRSAKVPQDNLERQIN